MPTPEKNSPELIGISVDGEPFKIDGVDVWKQDWNDLGATAEVVDPKYGRSHTFNLYSIKQGKSEIRFLAGEFSNCIWGFYRP